VSYELKRLSERRAHIMDRMDRMDRARKAAMRTMSLADQADAAERHAADRRAAWLIAGVAILCAAVVAIAGLMW
jgi:hypothetical protein